MLTAGIDCGAKTTKTAIMKDGQIIGKASVLTGFDQIKAVNDSLEKALKAAPSLRRGVQGWCDFSFLVNKRFS